MLQGISLCISYNFQVPGGTPVKSLYRIADYENGYFYKVDTQALSDYTDYFSPKYIRCRPGEDSEYYSPIIKKWHAVQKYGDDEKSTTESFPYDSIMFFEVVINSEYFGPDNDHIVSLLRNGIQLPNGVADNMLIVFDQDEEYYQAVFCKKAYFKNNGELYYLDEKIDDILHTHHSLDVYYIAKDEVFDTSSFGYFYNEVGTMAEVRYFYVYDELPQADRQLYLYHFNEYLSVYLSRYFRLYSKEIGLSKSNIQTVVNAVRKAISNYSEMDDFFAISGYQLSDYEDRLPGYEDAIVQYLDGSGFLDDIVTRILTENEGVREKMLASAKEIWLKQKDEERSQLENLLTESLRKQKDIQEATTAMERKYKELQEDCKRLNGQYENIISSLNISLEDFNTKIGEYYSNSAICHLFDTVQRSNGHEITRKGVLSKYPNSQEAPSLCVDDVSKACKILELNLRTIGMDAFYGAVLGNMFAASKSIYQSIIAPGAHARKLAHAFANSIDGCDATIITVTATNVNYGEVHDAILAAPGRIILIENLLDSCNELMYFSANKDFPEKLFIFSIENEENFLVLSKSIWNYGIFINTDIAIPNAIANQTFKTAVCSAENEVQCSDEDISRYKELLDILAAFNLPSMARMNFVRTMAYFMNNSILDMTEYIDSVIAKFCGTYGREIDTEKLNEIQEGLMVKIKDLYGY